MKKVITKVPTFLLGTIVGVALTASTVAGAASYLKATQSNVSLVVDGQKASLTDKPVNVNGKLYLPVRDTANALGYSIESVTSTTVKLKEGATKTTNSDAPTTNTTNDSTKAIDSPKTSDTKTTENNATTSKKVSNLKETYSTDGKLDATKIRTALDNKTLDVNAQDSETGNTLLHYLIIEDNYEAYKAINRNALNVNAQNNDGDTPLITTIKVKNDFYFGEMISNHRADAKIKNKEGKQAIDYSEKNSGFQIGLKGYMM